MSPKPSSRASSSASSSRGFDKELAELEALKGAPLDAAAIDRLRKSLTHRNNYVVSKAARLIEDAALAALLPDVLTAYDRFFTDAETTDPQCWAKNALVKTLIALEHRDKDAYLRGLRHHQLEGTWGGTTDTAGTLRGACAQALVNCPGIPDTELLALLIELFTDPDKSVRIAAAHAIGNVGGPSAPLLLRLRALLGSGEEPEVLGACYSALLDREGARAIPFVAGYLEDGDDTAAEAAFALSATHKPEALAALISRRRAAANPRRTASRRVDLARDDSGLDGSWFDGILLSAIALCRQPEALDYLLAIIERDERAAALAIEAIGRAAPSDETRARVEQAVRKAANPRLEQAMRKHMPSAPHRG
jgi:HEAT repeat protein